MGYRFWSSVFVRSGDVEPQRAFTYAIGDDVAGCQGVKASRNATCLEVQGRLPVLPFRIDKLCVEVPRDTGENIADVRKVAESLSADLYHIGVGGAQAEMAVGMGRARLRPWSAAKAADVAYYREERISPPMVVGKDGLFWVTVKFPKPLKLTGIGVLLRFSIVGEAVEEVSGAAQEG